MYEEFLQINKKNVKILIENCTTLKDSLGLQKKKQKTNPNSQKLSAKPFSRKGGRGV